jgi:hypothetical protein
MGAKTMFDLNQSLDDWRAQLRQGEGCSADNIDELEEHLREEMAGLTQAGLAGDEAFLLAVRRLGSVEVLKEEFEKVNTSFVWLNRLRWMAAGALIYLGSSVAETASRKVLWISAAMTDLNPYMAGILIPLISLAVMTLAAVLTLLAIKAYRKPRKLGKYLGTVARRSIFLLGVFLWFTLLPLGTVTMQVVAIRLGNLPPAALGRVAWPMSVTNGILSVVLPLVIAAWLLRTPRRVS